MSEVNLSEILLYLFQNNYITVYIYNMVPVHSSSLLLNKVSECTYLGGVLYDYLWVEKHIDRATNKVLNNLSLFTTNLII